MWRWILTTLFILSFCLGTSFITIPFALNPIGFWPSVIAVLITWGYLLITGFYSLEAVVASLPGANTFTISLRYLGKVGAWFSSSVCALVNYSYLIFFLYLIGPNLTEVLHEYGIDLSTPLILFFLCLLVGLIIFVGLRAALFTNLILIIFVGWIVFQCFVLSASEADSLHIKGFHWSFLMIVFPTLINSLYYNTLIPTLAPFLKFDTKLLKSSMIAAISIASLIFIGWLWLAIASAGALSHEGLSKINPEDISYFRLLKVPHFGKWLPLLLSLNIVSTMLGVCSVLVDFLADWMRVSLHERKGIKRLGLCALALLPPYLLNITPLKTLYLIAIYFTDIGPLYLAGLLPCSWIWTLRYYYAEKTPKLVIGGKSFLVFIAVISFFVFYLVGLELFYQESMYS